MAVGCPAARAADSTTVAIDRAAVGVGQTTAVAVHVRDVAGLYAAEVHLTFDPTAVQVVDDDPSRAGVQIGAGGFLEAGIEVRNQADNTAGTISYAATQLNPSVAKSGSGALCHVALRGLVPGRVSPIRIVEVALASRTGDAIAHTTLDGEIRVVGPADAPPTATTAPAAGPAIVPPTGPPGRATPEGSSGSGRSTPAAGRSESGSAPTGAPAADAGTEQGPVAAPQGRAATAITPPTGSLPGPGPSGPGEPPGDQAATSVDPHGSPDPGSQDPLATWTSAGLPDSDERRASPAGDGPEPGPDNGSRSGLPQTGTIVLAAALAVALAALLASGRKPAG